MVSKIVRTLLLNYSIIVSTIQDVVYFVTNIVNLDALIGELNSFGLIKFDNSIPKIEVAFKEFMTLVHEIRGKNTTSSSSTYCSNVCESILTK